MRERSPSLNSLGSSACPDEDRMGMVVEPSALPFLNSSLYDLQNVSVLVFNSWTANWARVESVTESNYTVRFRDRMGAPVGQYGTQGGHRFLVANAREGLDEEGEWYWDAAAGENRLYFLPPADVDVGTAEVVVPRLRTVVSIEAGARDVTLDGVSIEHATDGGMDSRARSYDAPNGALEVGNATGVTMRGVQVAHAGGACLLMHEGVSGVGVLGGSVLQDCGGDGFQFHSSCEDAVLQDSRVNDTGILFMSQPAGVRVRGQRNVTVQHCEVGYNSYGGILVGWQKGWPTPEPSQGSSEGAIKQVRSPASGPVFCVRYNRVHHYGMGILSDFGGVYVSSDDNTCFNATPNDCAIPTEVYQNLVQLGEHFDYGAQGLYTDEQASDVNVTTNLFQDIGDAGIFFHCGKNHSASNNIVAFTGRQPRGSSLRSCNAGGNPTWPNLPQGFDFSRNILLAAGAPLTTDSDYRNTTFDDDVYWTYPAGQQDLLRFPNDTTFAQWQAEGQDPHGVVADPLFADAAGRNFTLLPGSPALERGFVQFDYGAVGPRQAI